MKRPVYFTFEVIKPIISGPRAGRREKLTRPLFITPRGVIEEFPTQDDDFFTSMPEAMILPTSHPRIPPGSGYSRIMRSDLERSARYLRWTGGKKEDTRATLEESYAVFAADGRDGLKKRFSKTHVFYLLREFKKRGWET